MEIVYKDGTDTILLERRNRLKIFNYGIALLFMGCICCFAADDQDGTAVEKIKSASYKIKKTAADTGEKGVKTIKSASDVTGATKVVKGISQVIVDASEDIGQEKKGKILGQDATLFPPETENDGKILKIEF